MRRCQVAVVQAAGELGKYVRHLFSTNQNRLLLVLRKFGWKVQLYMSVWFNTISRMLSTVTEKKEFEVLSTLSHQLHLLLLISSVVFVFYFIFFIVAFVELIIVVSVIIFIITLHLFVYTIFFFLVALMNRNVLQ